MARPSGKGKPRGIRRDRDCLTCKSRGVKCDLNRPACGPCLSDNISCAGYTQRVVWATPSAKPSQSIRDSGRSRSIENPHKLQLDRNILSVIPVNIPAQDANWTTHCSEYLAYFRQKVEFQRVQQPHLEAFGLVNTGDPLSAVWTFATRRMSQCLSVGEVTSVDDVLSCTSAVAALRRAVDRSGIKAIFAIATFAFLDVYKGPFGVWQQHLRGARAVLDSYCTTEEQLAGLCSQTNGLREILSLLCWYDVTGLVVKREVRDLIFDDYHRKLMDDGIFDLVGCPLDAFMLLTAIAKSDSKNVALESNICVSAVDQLMSGSSTGEPRADLGQAWRCAAVLALFEVNSIQRANNKDRIKRQLIDGICQILMSIPPQSAKYRHLPFAAFMAGRHAQLSQHTQAVKGYWRTCLSYGDSIYPDGEFISRSVNSMVGII